ncbi:transposase, partial [Desulfocicer niacini]
LLKDHIHLHCLVPGGVLTLDKAEFKISNESFLFPVKALSKVFRTKFMEGFSLQIGVKRTILHCVSNCWKRRPKKAGLPDPLRRLCSI